MPSKEAPRQGHDFGFTEQEKLYYRVSHERFTEIFEADETDVHRIELSSNSYGEFLFITLSRETDLTRQPVTFFGLGYHDYRERWIHKEWHWYNANAHPSTTANITPKEEATELLGGRENEIAAYVDEDTQTKRGQLFEMIADLTDDDGAIAEMDDFGILFDDSE